MSKPPIKPANPDGSWSASSPPSRHVCPIFVVVPEEMLKSLCVKLPTNSKPCAVEPLASVSVVTPAASEMTEKAHEPGKLDRVARREAEHLAGESSWDR